MILICLTTLFVSCADDDNLTVEEISIENRTTDIDGIVDLSRQGKKNNDIARLDNDILKDWTDMLLSIEQYATGMRPNATARSLAYIYLTAYETAVPGMRDYESNSRRLDDFKIRNDISLRDVNFELALSIA